MGYLTWWSFPRRAWLIIIAQLGAIGLLLGLLYSTYVNNVYFQEYVNSLSPVLFPALSIIFGISSASLAAYLYISMRRVRVPQEPQYSLKKRVPKGRVSKRPTQSPSPQLNMADLPQTPPAKLKPIAPPSRASNLKPPPKEREAQGSTLDKNHHS